VAGFFKPDSSAFQIVSFWGTDNNNYLRIGITSDGNWEASVQVNQNNFTSVIGGAIDTSSFTHVAACWDGSDVFLLEDGTETQRTSTAADLTQIGAGDLVTAEGGQFGNPYAGLSDNPSWANKALTESEAQALIDQC
jgi:hypothetical protein